MPAAKAVEALIREYGKLVFQTIYGLTGDWEESQDLTQDTLLQALTSVDAARAKSGSRFRAKAWLLQIELNTLRIQRRRRSVLLFIPFSLMQKEKSRASKGAIQEADIDVLNERAAPVQPAGFGATEGIDLEAFVTERDAVQRTLGHLSEPLRICLLLSVIGQFPTAEIAEMLDIEEAAARQRLSRARKQFQHFYAIEGGEEVVDNAQATSDTAMSQIRPARHHSNAEQVDMSVHGRGKLRRYIYNEM